MSRRRRGFTMVEILIVIGVIILLVGIGVIAYRGLDKMASSRATNVAFDNANAMVAEYEHGGNIVNLPVYDPVNADPTQSYPATSPNTINAHFDPSTPQTRVKWDVTESGGGRVACITQCGIVVDRLSRLPKNKQALSGLPQKALLVQPSGSVANGPALADGWRCPIILAPAGGIKVTFEADTPQAHDVIITSPDHRPFWVSAGPDGDFAKGDDNVYSFSK